MQPGAPTAVPHPHPLENMMAMFNEPLRIYFEIPVCFKRQQYMGFYLESFMSNNFFSLNKVKYQHDNLFRAPSFKLSDLLSDDFFRKMYKYFHNEQKPSQFTSFGLTDKSRNWQLLKKKIDEQHLPST